MNRMIIGDNQKVKKKNIITKELKSLDISTEKRIGFFVKQIENEFDKIVFIDKALNKEKHLTEVTSYFHNKLTRNIKKHLEATNQFKFYDLFAGAGGLSSGLEKANLAPQLALDKDKSSLLTYHFNRPFLSQEQVINDDIKVVSKDFEFKKVPLVVGGPPCQGFSNANKQKKVNDDRNQLYKFYLHTVKHSTPDIFLLENVPGILEFIDIISKDFKKIKYTLFPFVLNTKDFGFPQNRKRVFIIGLADSHSKIFSELMKIFNDTIENNLGNRKFNLWDSIGDLPTLKAKSERNSTFQESKNWGYTFGNFTTYKSDYSILVNDDVELFAPVLNHKSKFNNERDIKIYGLLKPGDKSDSDKIADINPYLNREDIFKDKF